MVQNDIRGVVHSDCQVLNRASAKLIHAEDVVVDVCHAVDVVFKDIDAEGMMQLCIKTEGMLETCRQCECEPICGSYVTQLFLMLFMATTGSLPFSLTLQIKESLASAQYSRSLK